MSRNHTRLISANKNKDDLVGEAKLLCERMAYDMNVFKTLSQDFPGRILSVKYEDLVVDPVEHVHEVYQFLGLETPRSVFEWFTSSMSGVKNTGCYGTQRMDSKGTAFEWRNKLTGQNMTIISEFCAGVIAQLTEE
jgi:hypothetical protein